MSKASFVEVKSFLDDHDSDEEKIFVLNTIANSTLVLLEKHMNQELWHVLVSDQYILTEYMSKDACISFCEKYSLPFRIVSRERY